MSEQKANKNEATTTTGRYANDKDDDDDSSIDDRKQQKTKQIAKRTPQHNKPIETTQRSRQSKGKLKATPRVKKTPKGNQNKPKATTRVAQHKTGFSNGDGDSTSENESSSFDNYEPKLKSAARKQNSPLSE